MGDLDTGVAVLFPGVGGGRTRVDQAQEVDRVGRGLFRCILTPASGTGSSVFRFGFSVRVSVRVFRICASDVPDTALRRGGWDFTWGKEKAPAAP